MLQIHFLLQIFCSSFIFQSPYHSISKIPQLNSKEENRLGEVLDYEGWELVMKVCAAT